MLTSNQEQFVFRHLSLIDMERVQKSIEILESTEDKYFKEALFRDAVVSYIKPFSDNCGEKVKRGLKLKEKCVPKSLMSFHREIVKIRNQLFAHNDLAKQQPKFGPGTSFSINGYETIYYSHLIEPLKKLSMAVHSNLIQEIDALKINGL